VPAQPRTLLHGPALTSLLAVLGGCDRLKSPQAQKKADVVKHPKVLNHVGLLCNEPPGAAGLPFIKSSEIGCRTGRLVRSGSSH
jgi:hypothetical protein